jgi:transcriptional regulator with XRE-family HTH domain
MVESENNSTYGARLAQALSLPGHQIRDKVELAERLNVSRQAIEKLLKGRSKEMGAANNANAARLLGVDATWLATGVGLPRPGGFQIEWQERLLIEQFRELPSEDKADVAGLVLDRLELKREHEVKGTADPYHGVTRGSLHTPMAPTGTPAARPKAKRNTK